MPSPASTHWRIVASIVHATWTDHLPFRRKFCTLPRPLKEESKLPYIFPLFHSPRKVTEISRLFPSNSQQNYIWAGRNWDSTNDNVKRKGDAIEKASSATRFSSSFPPNGIRKTVGSVGLLVLIDPQLNLTLRGG
jgi:hypothetical protein